MSNENAQCVKNRKETTPIRYNAVISKDSILETSTHPSSHSHHPPSPLLTKFPFHSASALMSPSGAAVGVAVEFKRTDAGGVEVSDAGADRIVKMRSSSTLRQSEPVSGV
jgi:hypothetical protein